MNKFKEYNNYELKAAVIAAYEDMEQQRKKLPDPYAALRILKAAEFINEIEDELHRRAKAKEDELHRRAKAKEEDVNALATHMHAALQMQNDFDAAVQQHQNYINQLQMDDAVNAAAMPPMMF